MVGREITVTVVMKELDDPWLSVTDNVTRCSPSESGPRRALNCHHALFNFMSPYLLNKT